MKELFPNFLQDPDEYARAVQFWHGLWISICPSPQWQERWLITSFENGTPFMDGDGILNAINTSTSRAFKVVHTQLSGGSTVRSWSSVSEFEDTRIQLTVIAGPLTEETVEQFTQVLRDYSRGR